MIEVRTGQAGDRAALCAILGSDRTFRPDEIDVALELIDGALSGDDDFVLRVATEDGVPRGYICFGPTPMTRATWDLYWIVVAAEARSRGVARALIAAMEGELAAGGGGQVRVETSPAAGHAAARALYARLGYPMVAELADFYAPGEAMLLYYKRIEP